MARGTQLGRLLTMLKGELGDSLDTGVATANDARYRVLLCNKQVELGGMYTWPFLRDRQDVSTVNAQRFYPLPDLNYDRPHSCQVKWNNIWTDLHYGITERDYNIANSLLTPPVQIDPVLKWLIVDQAAVTPPNNTPVFLGAGPGITGTYTYALTYVTPNGETTIGTAYTVSPANQIPTVTVQIAQAITIQGVSVASPVTARKIYRTKNGGTTYYLLATVSDNTTFAYADTTTDANLTTLAPNLDINTAQVSYFEVWPVPITVQSIRFTGELPLNNLTADTDLCQLDDLMLVYAVAAEEAARRELKDAPFKAQKFQQRLSRQVSAGPTLYDTFVIGEWSDASRPPCGPRRRKVLLGGHQ